MENGYPTPNAPRGGPGFRSPNPYNKGLGYAKVPVSQGEMVPYQSGPAPSRNRDGHGRGLASFGRRIEGQLARQALGKALARATALGRFVDTMLDLYELLESWERAGLEEEWYRSTFHPPGAFTQTDCNAPTHGPTVQYDGSCTESLIASEWPPEFGYQTVTIGPGAGYYWNYLRDMGPYPLNPSVRLFRKAQRWKAPYPGLPPAVRALPMPASIPSPVVNVSGAGATRTPITVRTPHRRPSERKKGLAQRGFGLAVAAYDKADEAGQVIDILWNNLSPACRGAKGNRLQMAADIARCAGTLDLNQTLKDLVANEIEDQIVGRAHKAGSQPIRGGSAPRSGVGAAF